LVRAGRSVEGVRNEALECGKTCPEGFMEDRGATSGMQLLTTKRRLVIFGTAGRRDYGELFTLSERDKLFRDALSR